VQFGHQEVDIDVPQIQGSRPELRFDPNTVVDAVNADAAPNPYAGRPYFDGDYRRDKNISEYDEIRVSTSYNLNTDNFGRHRFAIAASEVDEKSRRGNTWLALGGNPDGAGTFTDSYGNRYTNSAYLNADNRVTIRNYFDFENFNTWKAGSWKSLPTSLWTDRYTPGVQTAYPVVWAEDTPGNINYKINQVTESYMAVSQSHFLNNKLVVTLGYRKDDVTIDRPGHYRDPIIGWIPDLNIKPDTPSDNDTIPGAPQTKFNGTVRTTGAVYHIFENFSLVANQASNIGIPDFRRTDYPIGATSPPPDGDGVDFGIDFRGLDNRISGRIVYYETNAVQEVVGGNDPAVRAERMYASLETAFDDAGATSSLDDLLSRRQELRPEVNGRFRDNVSSGYELRLTANITDNWRLQFNASKTDRIVSNSFSQTVPFLGFTIGDDGRAVQGVRAAGEIPDPEDPESTIIHYEIDPAAYTSDGVISKLLAYESQLPEGQTFDTITDNGTRSFAQSLFEAVDEYNGDIEVFEKRWGLRPYRVNIFTTYDFKEGFLKGWSVGGGYRWSEANIIGEENGVEFPGEAIAVGDLLLRYRTARGAFFGGDGRWTFQLNVENLFDNRKIIASRLAIDGNTTWQVPGGRGIAYARFDLPDPREYRFTVTYDF
jgi:iron complex outermembrane recepter protein